MIKTPIKEAVIISGWGLALILLKVSLKKIATTMTDKQSTARNMRPWSAWGKVGLKVPPCMAIEVERLWMVLVIVSCSFPILSRSDQSMARPCRQSGPIAPCEAAS